MRAIWLSLVLLAACGAGLPSELMIRVRVSGAVDRVGSYHRALDGTHLCQPAIEVPPAPGPGGHFDNLPYRVEFAPAARPPDSSFRLEIPFVSLDRGRHAVSLFKVTMTAGGHLWHGESPSLPGSAETEDGGARGRFRIEGLQTTDANGTITVEGEWNCPTWP